MIVDTRSVTQTRPSSTPFERDLGRRTIVRLLGSIRDLWDGSSWEPGRDWLTRVEGAEGERQTPR
jgi:hypothetical protein